MFAWITDLHEPIFPLCLGRLRRTVAPHYLIVSAAALHSIALVADDGREFYGERSDYDDESCSAFVREAVLPQLGQVPGQVFTREGLRTAVLAWLEQFADEAERCFCMDYVGDGIC